MGLFEQNWIASHWVDFEYKKYQLLAYLQQVDAKYSESKVYPYVSILQREREEMTRLHEALRAADSDRLEWMLYGEPKEEPRSAEIEHLYQMTTFALPRLSAALRSGKELEAFVQQSIDFLPVGVLPVNKREGYLIFRQGQWTRSYRYALNRITPGADNEIHSVQLKTWFVQKSASSRFRTLSDIKYELIKEQPELPNPATYAIECPLSFPYPETLVPIGRKLLYQCITAD